MLRRRRRRFKGTWLPNIGTVPTDPTNLTSATAGRETVLVWDPAADTQPTVGVIPLTFDTPQEPDAFTSDIPMGYFLNNEYKLVRLVGKLFATPLWNAISNDTNPILTNPPAILYTSGFFIARAQDELDTNGGADVPIGFATSFLTSYNPDIPDTIREPWLWRRQWILGNNRLLDHLRTNGFTNSGAIDPIWAHAALPPTTANYGSVADGPHIDAKTRRKVGNDDRLWWAQSIQPYPRFGAGSFPYTGVIQLQAHLDYRLFGQTRKGRNRGNF